MSYLKQNGFSCCSKQPQHGQKSLLLLVRRHGFFCCLRAKFMETHSLHEVPQLLYKKSTKMSYLKQNGISCSSKYPQHRQKSLLLLVRRHGFLCCLRPNLWKHTAYMNIHTKKVNKSQKKYQSFHDAFKLIFFFRKREGPASWPLIFFFLLFNGHFTPNFIPFQCLAQQFTKRTLKNIHIYIYREGPVNERPPNNQPHHFVGEKRKKKKSNTCGPVGQKHQNIPKPKPATFYRS